MPRPWMPSFESALFVPTPPHQQIIGSIHGAQWSSYCFQKRIRVGSVATQSYCAAPAQRPALLQFGVVGRGPSRGPILQSEPDCVATMRAERVRHFAHGGPHASLAQHTTQNKMRLCARVCPACPPNKPTRNTIWFKASHVGSSKKNCQIAFLSCAIVAPRLQRLLSLLEQLQLPFFFIWESARPMDVVPHGTLPVTREAKQNKHK